MFAACCPRACHLSASPTRACHSVVVRAFPPSLFPLAKNIPHRSSAGRRRRVRRIVQSLRPYILTHDVADSPDNLRMNNLLIEVYRHLARSHECHHGRAADGFRNVCPRKDSSCPLNSGRSCRNDDVCGGCNCAKCSATSSSTLIISVRASPRRRHSLTFSIQKSEKFGLAPGRGNTNLPALRVHLGGQGTAYDSHNPCRSWPSQHPGGICSGV